MGKFTVLSGVHLHQRWQASNQSTELYGIFAFWTIERTETVIVFSFYGVNSSSGKYPLLSLAIVVITDFWVVINSSYQLACLSHIAPMYSCNKIHIKQNLMHVLSNIWWLFYVQSILCEVKQKLLLHYSIWGFYYTLCGLHIILAILQEVIL